MRDSCSSSCWGQYLPVTSIKAEGMSHTVCTQKHFCSASPAETLALSAQLCPKHASWARKDVALLPRRSTGNGVTHTYSHNKRHFGATLRNLCSPGSSYQFTTPLFLLQENIFNVKLLMWLGFFKRFITSHNPSLFSVLPHLYGITNISSNYGIISF